MTISSLHARQILDSRGFPTVEADVYLENGTLGRAAVPSGASTGKYEALELRDGEAAYNGKSVLKAVQFINTDINDLLKGVSVLDQAKIDSLMIDADGTDSKEHFGANALLAVSLAAAHAAARSKKIHLFSYFQELSSSPTLKLPVPMMNIINGGKHASGSTDIQEFMIMPIGAESFSKALEMGSNTFHSLGKVLKDKGYGTTVGDEGGFAPSVKNGNKEALELISLAVERAGYILGKDIVFALDIAASELYKDSFYHLTTENKILSTNDWVQYLSELSSEYPIVSIEDGLSEDDFPGWVTFTEKLGKKIQIVGDDLFVTNPKRISTGIKEKQANAVLIKLNQIGTLTETLHAVKMTTDAQWNSIISHRSGETEDTTIAHLAVGLGTGQIKTGSLSRTDRIAKYNELLRIEEILGEKAYYPGKEIFS